MYSDAELDAAVAAGAISAQAVADFRAFADRHRAAPDEEQFRLLTGFNDIFISIAILVFLVGAGWLTARLVSGDLARPLAGGVVVTALSWGLAEYFTRRRRLSLPSIVLAVSYGLGASVLATAAVAMMLGLTRVNLLDDKAVLPLAGLAVAAVFYVHWRRFAVPITVAFCAVAVLAGLFAALAEVFPALTHHMPVLFLIAGLAVFALAMRWDISDRNRATRRTDVAFWLHLAAAPMIAHSLFAMFGVLSPAADPAGRALLVVGIYLVMTLVALAIDRRALLTAALVYVLVAISSVIHQAGSPDLSFALSGFIIGAALLMLSAFWNPARRFVIGPLPESLRAYLPVISAPYKVRTP